MFSSMCGGITRLIIGILILLLNHADVWIIASGQNIVSVIDFPLRCRANEVLILGSCRNITRFSTTTYSYPSSESSYTNNVTTTTSQLSEEALVPQEYSSYTNTENPSPDKDSVTRDYFACKSKILNSLNSRTPNSESVQSHFGTEKP